MPFAKLYHQGVELVIVLCTRGCIIFSECKERKLLHLCITYFFAAQAMPCDEPPQILVHYHDWLIESVEQDGVGCFRPNSWKSQQLLSRFCRVL